MTDELKSLRAKNKRLQIQIKNLRAANEQLSQHVRDTVNLLGMTDIWELHKVARKYIAASAVMQTIASALPLYKEDE